jgi:ribosome biogenesis GTPase
VRAAVDSGALPAERLANYFKLIGEAQVAAAKTDVRLRAEEERKGKSIAQARRDLNARAERG